MKWVCFIIFTRHHVFWEHLLNIPKKSAVWTDDHLAGSRFLIDIVRFTDIAIR